MSVIREYATGRDIHIDTPLSNLSIAYMQDTASFVGGKLFPDISVTKRSDVYYVFNKGDMFRTPGSTLRAQKSSPKIIEFAVSSNTYYCNNYALAGEIAWEDRANADTAIPLERATVEQVTDLLMLDREQRIVNAVTSTSNVGSSATLSGVSQWNDYGNSDPFNDITIGMQSVHGTTGKEANTIIIGRQVFDVLKNHPDVLDRIKYTQRGVVTADLIANLISTDRPINVYVGGAVQNTGQDGLADTFSYVWGKNVFIGHVAPNPGQRVASFGYSFRWRPTGFRDMSVLRKVDIKGNYADRLDVMYFADEVITGSDLSYLITSVVS